MSIAKNIILNFSANTLGNLLFFAAFIIYSRLLGPQLLGIFHIQYLLVIIIPIVFISFIDYSLAFHLRQAKAQSDKAQYLTISLLLSYLIGVFYAVFIFCFKKFFLTDIFKIPIVHQRQSFLLLKYFLIYFLIQIFISNIKSVMIAEDDFKNRTILIFIYRFFVALTSVLFLYFGGLLSYISLGFLIGSLFAFTYAFVYAFKKRYRLSRFSSRQLYNFLRYGQATLLINLGTQISDWIDSLLLAILLNPETVGLYAVAYNVFNQVSRFPKIISEAVFPKMVKATREELSLLVKKLIRIIAIIQIPLSCLFFFFGAKIITIIYGPAFNRVGIVLKILSLPLFFSAYWSANMVLLSQNKPSKMAKSLFVSLALNIFLNIILIPTLGLAGAAVATSISFLVYYFLSNYYLKQILNQQF